MISKNRCPLAAIRAQRFEAAVAVIQQVARP